MGMDGSEQMLPAAPLSVAVGTVSGMALQGVRAAPANSPTVQLVGEAQNVADLRALLERASVLVRWLSMRDSEDGAGARPSAHGTDKPSAGASGRQVGSVAETAAK